MKLSITKERPFWRNRMNRLRLLLAIAVLSATVTSCSNDESPTEPTGTESISLTSVNPPDGTKIAPKTIVNVTATLSSQESCSTGGTITMTITDQNGKVLSPDVSKFISDGRHSTMFAASFTVPATGVSRVDVMFRLHANDFCCFLCLFEPTTSASYPVG
jgi:hypothetical protein